MSLSLIPVMLTQLLLCKSQRPGTQSEVPDSHEQESIDYFFVSDTLHWNAAQAFCQDSCDSNLASIQDAAQYGSARSVINKSTTDNVWIGLKYMTDDHNHGEWAYLWIDHTLFNYTPANYTWTQLQHQCICMSPNGEWQEQNCSVPLSFLCNSCWMDESEEMETKTVLAIVLGSVGYCFCCIVVVLWCHKNKPFRLQLLSLNDIMYNKVKRTLNAGVPGAEKDDKLTDLRKIASASNSEKDIKTTMSDEGNVDQGMVEGVQAEGHTQLTKIESAVHLDVNPVGVDNDNNEKKEAVILDCMLSDVMKMPSLDPNKIDAVYSNEAENKNENESDSDSDTDNMYQEENNAEKEEEKPREGNDAYLNLKAGDDKNVHIPDVKLSKMESLAIDTNGMEDVLDNIEDIFNENNENESGDT